MILTHCHTCMSMCCTSSASMQSAFHLKPRPRFVPFFLCFFFVAFLASIRLSKIFTIYAVASTANSKIYHLIQHLYSAFAAFKVPMREGPKSHLPNVKLYSTAPLAGKCFHIITAYGLPFEIMYSFNVQISSV